MQFSLRLVQQSFTVHLERDDNYYGNVHMQILHLQAILHWFVNYSTQVLQEQSYRRYTGRASCNPCCSILKFIAIYHLMYYQYHPKQEHGKKNMSQRCFLILLSSLSIVCFEFKFT